jgi:hypothetical protein
MTTVTLATVWLNLASDLSDYEYFSNMSSLQADKEQVGEAREYANGRIRLVLKSAVKRSIHVTLPVCTRAQIEWLEDNAGSLMCVRDDRGRKFWGTYFTLAVTERSEDIDSGDVTFDFREVTHSEAV